MEIDPSKIPNSKGKSTNIKATQPLQNIKPSYSKALTKDLVQPQTTFTKTNKPKPNQTFN